MESLMPGLDAAPAALRANVALARGGPYFLTGQLTAARECLAEAIACAREAGDMQTLAVALTTLATATPVDEGYEEASRLLEEAVETSREAEWPWGIAFAELQRGALLLRDRRLAEAMRIYERCLEIGEQLDDDSIRGLAILPLGVTQVLTEDFDAARATLTRGALICRRNSNHESFAYCLESFAGMFRGQGRPQAGAKLLGAAATIREVIAIPVWPFYRPLIETLEASLREDLGDAYEGLYEAGRAMSEDEAANFALRTSEEPIAQSAEDIAARKRSFSTRVP
jgi:tetratricopeptide (TPR) repeat protein